MRVLRAGCIAMSLSVWFLAEPCLAQQPEPIPVEADALTGIVRKCVRDREVADDEVTVVAVSADRAADVHAAVAKVAAKRLSSPYPPTGDEILKVLKKYPADFSEGTTDQSGFYRIPGLERGKEHLVLLTNAKRSKLYKAQSFWYQSVGAAFKFGGCPPKIEHSGWFDIGPPPSGRVYGEVKICRDGQVVPAEGMEVFLFTPEAAPSLHELANRALTRHSIDFAEVGRQFEDNKQRVAQRSVASDSGNYRFADLKNKQPYTLVFTLKDQATDALRVIWISSVTAPNRYDFQMSCGR